MKIGLIEPHLLRFGGIRRMVEFANRLTARGHEVTFFLPKDQDMACGWMRCDANVREVQDTDLDVLIFNDERQWYLLDEFPSARRRVFYALHDGALYGKGGSWESLHTPVDLRLANSTWTADQIEARTGERPVIQLGGVNRELFRPQGNPKRFDLLTTGSKRWWKGTDTIRHAAALAGVALETYEDLDLSQPALARTYDQARVFVVGSLFEGFGQPGLEAMATGVPLVTTDNGGSRDYAIAGVTALVVEPSDAQAMADAITRLLTDATLAAELADNGLALVGERFNWETRTDELAEVLDGVVASPSVVLPRASPNSTAVDGHSAAPPLRDVPSDPDLSVIVLGWNNLELTMECVESIRQNTDVPYELIIVDNGSTDDSAHYARRAGDRSVLHPVNTGFAHGMNSGLALARGRFVAFCNNDTVLPQSWASQLIETLESSTRPGIVVPAVTAANNPSTVRTQPGTSTRVFNPFEAPPSAVVYVAPAELIRDVGRWDESYKVASGEDVDLAFTVWCNERDIVVDERVLVHHVGKASARNLHDWENLWAENRRQFLTKWSGDGDVVRLADVDEERFARNRRTAAAAAGWMTEFFETRDRLQHEQRLGAYLTLRRLGARQARSVAAGGRTTATNTARGVLRRLPQPIAERARRLGRPLRRRLDNRR